MPTTPTTTTQPADSIQTDDWHGVSRRTILKSTAVTSGVIGLGLPVMSTTARGQTSSTPIDTCNQSLDIVLALDYSGSIGSGLWNDIESGAASFIDVLADDNQLGIVTFGDTAKAYDFGTNEYLQVAHDGSTDTRPALKNAVPGTAPPNENGTHMPAALDFANDILDGQGRGAYEVIILLTDGEPNYQNGVVGDGSQPPEDEADGTVGGVTGYVPTDTTPFDPESDGANTHEYTGGSTNTDPTITPGERDETADVATAVKSDGTRIIAVGIGSGVDSTYLQDNIATAEDDYVEVTDSEALGADLQALLTEICDECSECVDEGLLAKYEFSCVDVEDDECVASDFVLETGDTTHITYDPGSFESKPGEAFEPITATFTTDYCTLYAVIKAGPTLTVEELSVEDGTVTVDAPGKYALSFVAFYCDEETATTAAADFPAHTPKNDTHNGRGRGRGRGR